jgi:hypothetical protein
MMTTRRLARTLILSALLTGTLSAQQIPVTRIEAMPTMPSPYLMRDWKAVARGYDSLAFDLTRSGQYLPLVFLNANTVNYPGQTSFGLHTYVGDSRSGSAAEAINVLPAVNGATLLGIDKRAQLGRDWVLMSREFFNNRAAENVYLNSPVVSSGDDWWYDVMPNIFFYQLYSAYPATPDYSRQFTTVADRWLQAMYAMGGSITPWSHPGLEHRGWHLSTMTPNNQTPHEPEAGGSLAWLLYQASVVTGNLEYRSGAELFAEELNAYTSNPAYELQLSYGAMIAARMNAEIGTSFDVPKLVNWCFDVSPIRSWGAVVGTWGGLDCSGLIGEVNGGNDYAFAMNTFEQVGTMVPLVRYDPRFARSIGRWVLNAANASRYFYGNYLPDANQDSRTWTTAYDSSSVLSHEALRQTGPASVSPYATGDAIGGGWAPTNLSLYSSSHVGILGAIIDTTNVPGILKLDLLATDYFHAAAYPSYLVYNPDTISHVVQIAVGDGAHDVYDAAGKQYVLQGVSGTTGLPVPSHEAIVAVITPSGGTTTFDEETMLVNGIVVDFHSTNVPANHRPRIRSLGAAPPVLYLGGKTTLYCTGTDRDGDTLAYAWSTQAGTFAGTGATVTWNSPAIKGLYPLSCIISDGKGGFDSAIVTISVVDSALSVPAIQGLLARPSKLDIGGSTTVTCLATDPKGSSLSYSWHAAAGTLTGGDSVAHWDAPALPGNYTIACTVKNTQGGTVSDSILIPVRDFSQGGTAGPILSIPFAGSVTDVSGYNNQLFPTDIVSLADRFGAGNNAGGFNGATSTIRITNTPTLNCDSAITVCLWMKPGLLGSKEQFLISHGSWQNRWKISMIPEGKIRWTVKTTVNVKDIDSRTTVASGVYHMVTATYNGTDLEIYVDGELESFTGWSGRMLTPAIDLMVGQMLPTDFNYPFNGVIDDILIYNYALTYPQIQSVYTRVTGIEDRSEPPVPQATLLHGVYPNPFNPSTVVSWQVSVAGTVRLAIYDVLGREVAVLVNETKNPGRYTSQWNASGRSSGVYFCVMKAGAYAATQKMLLIR